MADKRDKDKIKSSFSSKFLGAIGVIEGSAGMIVQIVSVSCSCGSTLAKEFGCEANEEALLVECVPAGEALTAPKPGKRKIFPKSFRNLPVYYRRGRTAVAL